MIHILMPINPKPLSQILNGIQTIIILKRIPKELKNGKPCTFWGYCTKGSPYLLRFIHNMKSFLSKRLPMGLDYDRLQRVRMNGKVVCKFVVEKVRRVTGYDYVIDEYSKPFFEIHITSLEIIEPMKLEEFYNPKLYMTLAGILQYEETTGDKKSYRITKAPSDWMYVLPPKEGEGK